MKKQDIKIEFDDIQLLTEVIEWYNKTYVTDCEIISAPTKGLIIRIQTEASAFIDPIFQIGSQIGRAWMRKNYRIEFTGWFKIIRKEIHRSDQSTYNFDIEFAGAHEETNMVNLTKLNFSESDLDVVKPFIKEADYNKLSEENGFTKREGWNQLNDYSKDGYDLSFIITEFYLLIFSKKNNTLILESIWSIHSTSF